MVEHFDVLIVGAGLSGVGAAYRLQTEHPEKTFAVLEARQHLGGTWDLYRYPGVRSDSDMFTLGFPFRPWRRPEVIADGATILGYLEEAARDYGLDERIRYGLHVERASWSSNAALWSVTARSGPDTLHFTCRFLYLCTGYYSYDGGYRPDFAGIDEFAGPVIHPQEWPAGLDFRDRSVVVIGSGATAVSLVPALAAGGAKVTLLQRSPSYIVSLPASDRFADSLRRVLPAAAANGIARFMHLSQSQGFYLFSRRFPRPATWWLINGARARVGGGASIERDFTPRYKPWDQRLCVAPDGDLFAVLRTGGATIVTDEVSRFTASGIELASGRHLDADIVVTATGLRLVACGNIELEVDGVRVNPAERVVYKGLMLAGVPNLAWCVGYTNASWTLRADLSSRYVCRLLAYLDRSGYDAAVPLAPEDNGVRRPILDLTSGYIRRAASVLPKQAGRAPWVLRQNYLRDRATMRWSRVTTGMRFARRGRGTRGDAVPMDGSVSAGSERVD
ncbi:flavin-containing monooxygenase [Diaminobutyricibacter sp. McL0608]|uniref:flavin-containing monooxygenase n=1 Tax=Leifsonia sp. McL0608 TaxID=3143537 RepID=UPI0031F32AF9